MTPTQEIAYCRGSRMAWSTMLAECVRNLGYESPEAKRAAWIIERESAIAQLRTACEYHGDNDWPDNLNLGDIIEKHLLRHLD